MDRQASLARLDGQIPKDLDIFSFPEICLRKFQNLIFSHWKPEGLPHRLLRRQLFNKVISHVSND